MFVYECIMLGDLPKLSCPLGEMGKAGTGIQLGSLLSEGKHQGYYTLSSHQGRSIS